MYFIVSSVGVGIIMGIGRKTKGAKRKFEKRKLEVTSGQSTTKKRQFLDGEDSLMTWGKMDNFAIIPIVGDGNCLFRAISFCLYGNEGRHSELRSLAINNVTEKWTAYKDIKCFEFMGCLQRFNV